MSFGFSVSDFITAIELANQIRKEFVDAPSQFKNISDEVKSLSNVLRDIEDLLPERELTTQQQTELHDIAEGCRNVFKKLEETLGKYQDLDCCPKTFGRKTRKVWKRLKWEPEDIKELRSRIIANITLLNAFQGRLASQISLATKDGVDRLHERQDDQERRTILDWLTPTYYGAQQSDFIGRRQDGTGQWLLDSDEFQKWFNESKQNLFCPGIPGAGKTMITSIIVEHLLTKFRNDPNIGIAYLYCDFRRQQEQKPADLLASLLKQLIQRRPFVPENVKNLYKRHNHERAHPSFNEISNVLHSVVADYSKAFIIIDALDECQVSDGGRRRLLSEIFNLQAKTGVSILATSRFIPEIMKEFEGCISIEIRASDDDVQRYLDGHMSRLPSCVFRNYTLKEKIKAEIIKAVDGMFLLAQLHLDSLIDKITPKAIRSALEKLPKGSDAYDYAYKEAMERIKGQKPGFQELAKRILSWITCAKRRLTTLELRHALAVEIGESELDEENVLELQDVISVCAGLVTVDEESDIIRLVHYTIQEFFERTQRDWFPNAETDIAKTCVTYLSFDIFKSGFCPTDKEFEARLQLNPFYNYASENWGHHARAASSEVKQPIMHFLESEAKVAGSSQAMLASKLHSGDSGYSQRVPRQMTGIHVAAYFGLREAMVALLENGYTPNLKDDDDRTPLSLAAAAGHHAVVTLLLAADGVDPNFKDDDDRTPLSLAAAAGHHAVVTLLLAADGVDPDSKDGIDLNSKDTEYGRMPLSWAAENGHGAVVKLLLAKDGIDLNSKDTEYGRTPLSLAARDGHEVVVQPLLATNGIDLDSKDRYAQTPLSLAAQYGHEAVVKLLLTKDGVNPDSKDDKHGRTPLLWAAYHGHEAVVKLLLLKDGVDPNFKDNASRTPLSWAAEKGHKEMVKLLLANASVNPDSRDNDDRTPLLWAAANQHEAVLELLLTNNGVDRNSKDNYGQTPLSWAAIYGHEAVVKLLLAEDDIDTDSKDTWGQTPLLWAAVNGHETVVKLLLAKDGVDPDSKDAHAQYGQTPLSWAAERGHKAVVTLLLAKDGVDSNSKDNNDRTPLSLAAGNGHEAVVELFLAKHAVNPDSKDRYSQTPLLLAAGNGHEAVVKLLLAKDVVDPNSKDKFRRTSLSWAARKGHSNVVKLLREKYEENGINIRDEDVTIATPPAADYPSRIICDICMSRIPDVDIHYHCRICSDEDFDVCQECVASGAFCLDQSHKLIKRTVKDGTLVETPDQT